MRSNDHNDKKRRQKMKLYLWQLVKVKVHRLPEEVCWPLHTASGYSWFKIHPGDIRNPQEFFFFPEKLDLELEPSGPTWELWDLQRKPHLPRMQVRSQMRSQMRLQMRSQMRSAPVCKYKTSFWNHSPCHRQGLTLNKCYTKPWRQSFINLIFNL